MTTEMGLAEDRKAVSMRLGKGASGIRDYNVRIPLMQAKSILFTLVIIYHEQLDPFICFAS